MTLDQLIGPILKLRRKLSDANYLLGDYLLHSCRLRPYIQMSD
jgi:hypothetical protein